jgi:hypothetical protein
MCPGKTKSVPRNFSVGPIYPNDIPLTLAIEEIQELAEVVDEASDLHPLRLAITSDRFCCLKEMIDLRQIGLQCT